MLREFGVALFRMYLDCSFHLGFLAPIFCMLTLCSLELFKMFLIHSEFESLCNLQNVSKSWHLEYAHAKFRLCLTKNTCRAQFICWILSSCSCSGCSRNCEATENWASQIKLLNTSSCSQFVVKDKLQEGFSSVIMQDIVWSQMDKL